MGVRLRATAMMLATLLAGCAGARGQVADAVPLAVYGSTATLEIAPVLVAARDFRTGAVVRNGGIGNLVDAEGALADVATHAETQALRYSVAHPDIRIILTVTEGRYRIVARRSAGIARVADLKGKRIATLASTSAGYFLSRMLAGARLSLADVVPVRISPLEGMAGALKRGEVDAVAIWEPHGGNAALALGDDAIVFGGDGVYRELFNLNTTAANLADPAKRRRIVAFVRAVIDAGRTARRDPTAAQALVAATAGFEPDEVARSWPTLCFRVSLPDDLLDVLVDEEKWLAAQDGRAPRSREALAPLIDRSVYAEAMALKS